MVLTKGRYHRPLDIKAGGHHPIHGGLEQNIKVEGQICSFLLPLGPVSLPLDMGTPASQAFGLRLGFIPSTP